MWAPLSAYTRNPHWGQDGSPGVLKVGPVMGIAWVSIGQFMSNPFGPHLPKWVLMGLGYPDFKWAL